MQVTNQQGDQPLAHRIGQQLLHHVILPLGVHDLEREFKTLQQVFDAFLLRQVTTNNETADAIQSLGIDFGGQGSQ
ncbi:MAG: hypothetical protein ACD_62C00396G0003 [uncultured bacterium]|nr:MAG: hypothetical protein ACD_62C00396G0003 [uncultured bacterium]